MKCFLYGLKGLGIEVAKNLILAGPAELTIHDPNIVDISDLASNFYCNENHVNKSTR